MAKRTKVRIHSHRPSLDSVEICDIPRRIFLALSSKLDFEQQNPQDLIVIRAEEKRLDQSVQFALDLYSKMLELESHTVDCDALGRANDALLLLRTNHAFFKSTNRRLLHAAFLEYSEACDHLIEMYRTIQSVK